MSNNLLCKCGHQQGLHIVTGAQIYGRCGAWFSSCKCTRFDLFTMPPIEAPTPPHSEVEIPNERVCICSHPKSRHIAGGAGGCLECETIFKSFRACKQFIENHECSDSEITRVSERRYLTPDFTTLHSVDSCGNVEECVSKDEVDEYLAELEAKFVTLVDAWGNQAGASRHAFPMAPCPFCKYNGQGYYQSSQHDCVRIFQEILNCEQ